MNEVYIDMRKENEWIRKYFNSDFVSIDSLLNCIEDLDCEIERLKEQIEDMQKEYEKDTDAILEQQWIDKGDSNEN